MINNNVYVMALAGLYFSLSACAPIDTTCTDKEECLGDTSTTTTWEIYASEVNGKLRIESKSTSNVSPYKGNFWVYQGDYFPTTPTDDRLTSQWEYKSNPWDTGLDYRSGLRIALIGTDKNNQLIYLSKIVTDSAVETSTTTTWEIFGSEVNGKLQIELKSTDNVAPYKGDFRVYQGDYFPTNPADDRLTSQWEDKSNPWVTGLDYRSGLRIALIATGKNNQLIYLSQKVTE